MSKKKDNLNHKEEFIKIIKQLSYSKGSWQVFNDFAECAMIAISQPFYKNKEMEEKYMRIIKNYSKDEANLLAKLMALTTVALEDEYQDFLGEMFISLELNNKWKGQFFTPYTISKFMAMSLINEDEFKSKFLVKVSDPCVGAGALPIAMVEAMYKSKVNYQQKVYFECIDIDYLAFCMAYVQLSLLGLPAKIIHGNTLSNETFKVLCTPVYFINNFKDKLEIDMKMSIIKSLMEGEYKREVKEVKIKDIIKDVEIDEKLQERKVSFEALMF